SVALSTSSAWDRDATWTASCTPDYGAVTPNLQGPTLSHATRLRGSMRSAAWPDGSRTVEGHDGQHIRNAHRVWAARVEAGRSIPCGRGGWRTRRCDRDGRDQPATRRRSADG